MKPLIIDNKQTTYLIDENGNIYNTKTKKYLTGTVRSGYRMVKLTIEKDKKDYCVHRLVALTFIDNPNNLTQVNHKDRNKLNNHVDNLEWITASENMQHVIKTGRKTRQPIRAIDETINESCGWKQYQDTNYWFHNDGRCANVKTKKFINSCIGPDGYVKYYLYINKKRIMGLAHRLVYETFVGKIDNNYQINHKDGNKLNNSIDNLELVTRSENMQHAYYVLNKKVKAVLQYDLEDNLIQEYPSLSAAARALNVDNSGICQACKGTIKTYKGFRWKYKEV